MTINDLKQNYIEGIRPAGDYVGKSYNYIFRMSQTTKLNPIRPFRSKLDFYSIKELDKIKQELT